ncbi:ketopantoate reductase family protein [Legionella sp. km772]|uniref:ketopantoate reductase family protein n=1 Tax=Legionella sp. km772 TaxID=2498111 RepID=UPI0013154BF4|nr:2-dehydropantoate 2-reductase [Legionella sp. km772]
MRNNPLWYIAGIGAVGSIIAASFCRGEQSVRLLLKNQQQLDSYQQSKLMMISEQFSYQCHPDAYLHSSVCEPINYLICCTKAYDVLPLVKSLAHALDEESIVLLIHNGMGVIEEVSKELPHLRIISGITYIGGYVEKPYLVRAFLNNRFYLGASVGQFTPAEITLVEHAFRASSLACEWTDSIGNLIWNKFAINCSINLLTVLFNCKNGLLIQHEKLLKQLSQEISSVLQAYGQIISADELFETIKTTIKNTAENYSSMYKDINNKRLTEIHYLNERLVELAEQKNIPAPLTSQLLTQFYTLFPDQKYKK